MKKLLLCGALILLSSTAVAAKNNAENLKDAKALGWTATDNLCGGYFIDGYIPEPDNSSTPLNELPVTISANQSQLVFNGTSTLSGDVEISQPGRRVSAEKGSLATKEGDFQTAQLQGQVTVREKGRIVVGKEAKLDLARKWYQLQEALYRLWIGNQLSAWGRAAEVTQPPNGVTELVNITYSTCPPQSRVWKLKAHRLELNREVGRGYAYDAILYAHGVPILYTPFFNFPIDNRRQTGFLYPQFTFGGSTGAGFSAPFYWNIAPNQDDTITPSIFAKRGFEFENLYRYLTPSSNGRIRFNILPNDAEFRRFQKIEPFQIQQRNSQVIAGLADLANADPTRTLIDIRNTTKWGQNWLGEINYTRASDDYFAQDLGGVPMIAQNQLMQEARASYFGKDFNFLANMQGFQTLHPVNEAVFQNQYNMLPQLLLASRFAPRANQLNLEWQAEGVEFTQAKNPGAALTSPSGERLNLMGAVSLPWNNIAGYLTPRLGGQLTQYNLGDQPLGLPDEITRTLPFFDIDGGLYFERMTNFFSKSYTQTLEPRLFYLYVPYRNQQDIPIFDSSLQPFSFNQLFLINRFSGTDRIGDADQISFALTSRFLDNQTGTEKFSASAGVIRYLQDRRVILCQEGMPCPDLNYGMGSSSLTDSFSPVVGQLQYHFNPIWSTSLDAAWDPDARQFQNSTITFHYEPLVNHIVNIGYSYVRNGDFFTLPNQSQPQDKSEFNLSQPTFSFAWPINDRWSAIGSFGYSLNRKHPLTSFGGVEYDSCCWAVQFILAKTFSGFDPYFVPQYNTGAYIQLVFKGLAKVAANDPASLLITSIPGYRDNFGV